MLIPVEFLNDVVEIKPRGVLHIGAHEAEEAADYEKFGWGPVCWIEMLPEKYEALARKYEGNDRNKIIHAACWDVDGVAIHPYLSNNFQSSSLLEPRDHLEQHLDVTFEQRQDFVLRTSRLDSILTPEIQFDFINIDVQGAELKALKGLGHRLISSKWVYSEVNFREIYSECPLIGDLDAFLNDMGFLRIATVEAGTYGWGDALYGSIRYNDPVRMIELRQLCQLCLGGPRSIGF